MSLCKLNLFIKISHKNVSFFPSSYKFLPIKVKPLFSLIFVNRELALVLN